MVPVTLEKSPCLCCSTHAAAIASGGSSTPFLGDYSFSEKSAENDVKKKR